jgi:hypothetical protein
MFSRISFGDNDGETQGKGARIVEKETPPEYSKDDGHNLDALAWCLVLLRSRDGTAL